MTERFRPRAAVYLLLIRDENVLLLHRYNTGWQDGRYSLVAGHLDGGETVVDAMVREAAEEARISIRKDDLHVVHTMHRKSPDAEYIDFFLTANRFDGEPENGEPQKCDELRWYRMASLPRNTLNHVKKAIGYYRGGVAFSEFGWNGEVV